MTSSARFQAIRGSALRVIRSRRALSVLIVRSLRLVRVGATAGLVPLGGGAD
jgi:hypothetical protein